MGKGPMCGTEEHPSHLPPTQASARARGRRGERDWGLLCMVLLGWGCCDLADA